MDNGIVDAHRHKVDADSLMQTCINGEFQLGPDAIGGGDKNRVFEAAGREVEQAAETAQIPKDARSLGLFSERADCIHESVSGIDIDACLAIGERLAFRHGLFELRDVGRATGIRACGDTACKTQGSVIPLLAGMGARGKGPGGAPERGCGDRAV